MQLIHIKTLLLQLSLAFKKKGKGSLNIYLFGFMPDRLDFLMLHIMLL